METVLTNMIATRLTTLFRSCLSSFLPVRQVNQIQVRPAASADAGAETKRLYAFGSSSCELFDYIFGTSPDYRSHWASGWSARGFLKAENRDYVLACLEDARRDDVIFLQFGNVDVQFNAAHRMRLGNFLDPAGFCKQAAEGILKMVAELRARGFSEVYCVYCGPPVPLPGNYYRKKFRLPGIPPRFQAQMFNEINRLVSEQAPLVDLSDVLADEYGVLKKQFRRSFPDHHADYIRIQETVWERIRIIPGMPARREEWRSQLYPHRPRKIRKLMEKGDRRPTDIGAREALGPDRRLLGGKAVRRKGRLK